MYLFDAIYYKILTDEERWELFATTPPLFVGPDQKGYYGKLVNDVREYGAAERRPLREADELVNFFNMLTWSV